MPNMYWTTLFASSLIIFGVPNILSGAASKNARIGRQKRTINADSHFQRWPDKNNIPYYLDNSYSAAEKLLIRQAAQQVQVQARGCIAFVEVPASDPRYKVKVTANNASATVEDQFCFAYPGKVAAFAGRNEQRTIFTHGPYGCLGKPDSLTMLMKFWTILLGRRNEHERGDRDSYISVNQNALEFPTAYRLYTSVDALWGFYPYDYCSITHNQPSDYAKPGQIAFTVRSGPPSIPHLPQLSQTDCQLIATLYGCSTSNCPVQDCLAARNLASGITTAATTTLSPTTTADPCSKATFCGVAPDESSFLLGPIQQFQTYLLFSGSCVAEYVMDYTTDKFKLQTQPQSIATYFPAPGGPSLVPPVTFAYMSLDPAGAFFELHMENQKAPSSLVCPTDPSVSTRAASCPTPATASKALDVSAGTSATSLFNLGDGQVYHLVVDAARSNIMLMDSTFATVHQRSNNFLTGQTKIAKVTAIQMVRDENGVNPDMLAVFGTGTDGVTPYVGFVVGMPLDAATNIALAPITWAGEPEPLKTSLQGC